MGFMDDMKESVKHSRREPEKKGTNSSLPPDYEPEPQHGSDHQQHLDNPQAYEPIKRVAVQSSNQSNNISNIAKALIVIGACFATVAYLKPKNTTPNSEIPAPPTPTYTAMSSASQQSAMVGPVNRL
jgi:hypothetical protein